MYYPRGKSNFFSKKPSLKSLKYFLKLSNIIISFLRKCTAPSQPFITHLRSPEMSWLYFCSFCKFGAHKTEFCKTSWPRHLHGDLPALVSLLTWSMCISGLDSPHVQNICCVWRHYRPCARRESNQNGILLGNGTKILYEMTSM